MMNRLSKQHRLSPLMFAMAVAVAHSAHADPTADAKTLPTITVKADAEQDQKSYLIKKTTTALPMAESVRDIPQSVSVITQQRLQDQNLTTLVEVAENVTGVTVNRYETNRGALYSRGFLIDNYIIDGVPTTYTLPWSSGEIFSSTALYDHIDVVRGATGLMYGVGNPSAAMNMVRKRATSKVPSATLEMSAGSWDNYRTMGDVATNLNDSGTIRGRAVAQYEQGNSYTDLLSKRKLSTLLSLEADLTDRTLFSAGVTFQRDQPRGPIWGGLPVWFSDGSRTSWSKNKTASADWTRWDVDYTNVFADITQKLNDDWTVKLAYDHGKRDANSKLLYLYGNLDKVTGLGLYTYAGSYDVTSEQDSVALQTEGKFALFNREQKVALGYQYSHQDFTAYNRTAIGGLASNFYTWTGSSTPEPTWSNWSLLEKYKIEQNSIFAATHLNVSDSLKVILGGRVTSYQKEIESTSPSTTIKFDNKVIPYVGLVYDLNDTYSAYASYTSIFLPQAERDSNGNYLDPIEGNSAEIGLKSAWFDGRLNGTLALYDIKQDNLAQATGNKIAGTTEDAYRAADGAKSKGFELELSGQVLPTWNVTVGYSQFKATDANGDDVNSQLPRKTIQSYTTYQLPGTWDKLTIGGGVNWQSSTYIIATNPLGVSERVQQDAYALVNLMAKYQINKDWSAQLNVNNVFDKDYYGIFPAYAAITQGAPRNAVFTVRYAF